MLVNSRCILAECIVGVCRRMCRPHQFALTHVIVPTTAGCGIGMHGDLGHTVYIFEAILRHTPLHGGARPNWGAGHTCAGAVVPCESPCHGPTGLAGGLPR